MAQATMAFPFTVPGGWPAATTAYLMPWFNGGCAWPNEYLYALNRSIPLACFWA
jgi:hypothetical protein